MPGHGIRCDHNKIECAYEADGCVKKFQVSDGEVHCVRDGWDETLGARKTVSRFAHNGEPYFAFLLATKAGVF